MEIPLLAVVSHNKLGKSPAQFLENMQQPPLLDTLDIQLGDETHKAPYLLLSEYQDDLGARLYSTLFDVVESALGESGLSDEAINNMGLFWGSSSFDICDSEKRYKQAFEAAGSSDYAYPLEEAGFSILSNAVKNKFDMQGPSFSFNTACTASANAMLYAHQLIEQGVIDHALVVGTEFSNQITAQGFYCLELLSDAPMLPFTAKRNGLNLGEACTAVVLGKSDKADKLASLYLSGGSSNCDSHSISAANPDGSTIEAVINDALECSAVKHADVKLIKAHGTASLSNDEAESVGVQRSFSSPPPCIALKPFVGHTLGACGVTELALLKAMIDSGKVLPNPAQLALDEEDQTAHDLMPLINQPITAEPGYYLLNYFGFGGNNTCLVLRFSA